MESQLGPARAESECAAGIAPVENGECSACHNPHVSRFDALLRERPGSLCVECHQELREAHQRPVVHEPVAEGRCADCHQPHGGTHDALLVKPSKELCRDCHAPLTEWEARSIQHPPFTEGRCSACHDPHAADHPGLAAEAGGGICSGCHPVNAAFKQRHGGYPVEQASCQQKNRLGPEQRFNHLCSLEDGHRVLWK